MDNINNRDLSDDIASMWAVRTAELQEELDENTNRAQKQAETQERVVKGIDETSKTGLKLSTVLKVINPELGAMAEGAEKLGKIAKETYTELNKLANELSNLSASMQLLGLDTSNLEGAVELASEMNELQVIWGNFISLVKKDLTSLYDSPDNLYEWLKANPIQIARGVSELGQDISYDLSNETIIKSLSKNIDSSSDVLNAQTRNITGQGIMTLDELNILSSALYSGFRSQGLLNDDANYYTADILGQANKLYNEKGYTSSAQFESIAKNLGKLYTTGKTDGLSNYGIGMTDNYAYGLAYQQGKNYKQLSPSEQIQYNREAFNDYINSTEEARLAMDKLGAEVKNNTSAIQSWQYLEVIGGKSTNYVGAGVNDFLAVNKDNEIITDELFGSEEDRKELIASTQDIVTKADMIYNIMLKEKNNEVLDLSELVLKNAMESGSALPVFAPSIDNNDPLSLDNVIRKNQGKLTVDEMAEYNQAISGTGTIDRSWNAAIQNLKEEIKDKTNGKIDLTVNTSPLFEILIDNKINEFMYNLQNKSFTK